MNNKKSIIVFVLTTAVLAGALVFDGVSHRRLVANNPVIAQSAVAAPAAPAKPSPAIPKPDAGVPMDSSTDVTQDSDSTPPDAIMAASEIQDDYVPNTYAVPVHRVILKHIGAAAATPVADAPQPEPAPAAPVVLAAAITSPDTKTPPPSAPKHSLSIPAGTVFTVRLGEELASDTSEIGQSFSATLDRDVTVNGKTAIAAGATMTGRVALARPVGPITGEPALELRLVSVNVNNSDVSLVTAIRTFGPKIKGKNKVSRFVKGLLKRYEHQEQEVVLDDQSAYSFTLRQPLRIR